MLFLAVEFDVKSNLALFDFDGTITDADTFTEFVLFATPKWRLVLGLVLIWPVILAFKLGWLPAARTRPIVAKVAFWHRSVAKVNAQAQAYVEHRLPQIVRPQAAQRLDYHRSCGDRIIVVSASLSPYLEIWCDEQQLELLCSQLSKSQGQGGSRYSGSYEAGDCSGQRKVEFINCAVNLDDYEQVFAYGDTDEDLPMLALADEAYLRWQPYQRGRK